MRRRTRPRTRPLAPLLLLALAATPLAAQGPPPQPAVPAAAPKNVLAVNPLAAAFQVYAGEYERVLAPTLGASVGGTYWSPLWNKVLTYSSADLRLRYYPRGVPLVGLSVGVVGGYTHVASDVARRSADAVGAGFEVNYSELAGAREQLYLAVGVGAKRLFPVRRELREFTFAYPTWRLAVGWAF